MKKIIFILIIILGLTFMSKTSLADDSKSDASTSKIDKNALYQKFLKNPFDKFKTNVDNFRIALAKEFQLKADLYKSQMDKIPTGQDEINIKIEAELKDDDLNTRQNYLTSKNGNPISLTWVTILFYIFTFLAYTFATAYIFYLLFGLIVFLVFRFIWTYLL